ncbi:MAG: acyltransferase [Actinomycetota bacterium]
MIHPSAIIDKDASIGAGTRVWAGAHIRDGASVGTDCIIGEHVYIGAGVRVGNNCKIQNNALVYEGATLHDGVFIGPGAIIANDRNPRAINSDGSLQDASDWKLQETVIGIGASIGAGAIVVPPRTIGEWAMIAAGAVVAHDVAAHALVVGAPAKQTGFVCKCGTRAIPERPCERCGYEAPR